MGLDQAVHQNTYPFSYSKGNPYKTTTYSELSLKLHGQTNSPTTQKVQCTSANIGYGTLFSPLLSKGTF